MNPRLLLILALACAVPSRLEAQCQEWLVGQLPFGASNGVNAMANYRGHLVMGMYYGQGPGGSSLVEWDGVSVIPFRNIVFNGSVKTLYSFKNPGVRGNYELVVGGLFSSIGLNICHWVQSPLPVQGSWSAMGGGFDQQVNAIERYNGATYAGGSFTHAGGAAMSHIAKWDPTNGIWLPVGSGLNGPVTALKVYQGFLYAGGGFTTAGGVSTGSLARWDGTSWQAVSGVFPGFVYSLEVAAATNELFIGGTFTGVANSPNFVSWNGTSFGQTGGVTNGANTVQVLSMTNGDHVVPGVGTVQRLYVTGQFSNVGGVAVSNAFYWDGAPHPVLGGFDAEGFCACFINGEVNFGGTEIRTAWDQGHTAIPVWNWVRYSDSGVPWFTQQPFSETVDWGGTANFTAAPAAGYPGLIQRGYCNGTPLNDGPSGTGSIYSGTSTSTLTVTNVSNLDYGDYHNSATTACGMVTTPDALLSLPAATGVGPAAQTRTSFDSVAPDPTHGPAHLSFSLARDARIRARILDVEGRPARTMDLGLVAAGHHQVVWDGRTDHGTLAGSGEYFIELDADGKWIGSRRLTRLR